MGTANLIHLSPASYRRTPWKNGGGVTVDIADAYQPGAVRGGWEGMLWRFGRTRIERAGPFSDLSGFERIIAVIEGGGLVLHAPGKPPLDLRAPFRPARFGGEWKIVSELTAGPVGVLNLLADRSRFAIDMAFLTSGAHTMAGPGQVIIWAVTAVELVVGDQPTELGADAALRFDTAGPVDVTLATGRIAIATMQYK